jgi:hypothetical protein
MWFVGVCIRVPGIVRFEKQTDGTRRTLRADPDVESGFKELITLRMTIPHFLAGTQVVELSCDDAFG